MKGCLFNYGEFFGNVDDTKLELPKVKFNEVTSDEINLIFV